MPSKLELLTDWLPRQHWSVGELTGPSLAKVGGFRLEDPAGAVGIEFMVVRDDAAAEVTAYLVPMTYRPAPLAGAEAHLIGTARHGVLGERWIYDGAQDPVLLTELAELIQGRASAQAQSQSNTPDATVHTVAAQAAPGERLEICFSRLLRPENETGPPAPAGLGWVTGLWTAPDGALIRSVFATARSAAGLG